MPPVCPRSCLTRWASVLSVPGSISATGPAAGPLAADGASERVTGSPSPGSTYGTVRGLPGYRVVLFGRAAVDHPARLPSTRLSAAGSVAFRDRDTLSTRDLRISGLLSCGPPARLTTLQPCPHGRRLQVWLPACWLGFDWVGIAPTGRLIRVLVYIPTSSLTGIAWSLPQQRILEPVLERALRRLPRSPRDLRFLVASKAVRPRPAPIAGNGGYREAGWRAATLRDRASFGRAAQRRAPASPRLRRFDPL